MKTVVIHCDVCKREIRNGGRVGNEPLYALRLSIKAHGGTPSKDYLEDNWYQEVCTQCTEKINARYISPEEFKCIK